MSNLLIYSANLGNFDKPKDHVQQKLPETIHQIEYWRCTDVDFPPRKNSMTPRLQARIVKTMGWQMKPDFDYYLWVDSSCRLAREDSAEWFLEQLGDADMAVFEHNKRQTVQEEATYLAERLELEREGRKKSYVLPRYDNERLNDQMAAVNPNGQLYATTALIYKNDTPTRDLMTIWWTHISLFHSIDQLSLDTAITHSGAKVNMIKGDYLKNKYLEYTR